MKSRITIEVDFNGHNEPTIQILSYPDSDDIRDKLIRSFLQKFAYSSCWARINWEQNHISDEGRTIFQRIFIKPIPPNKLDDESREMAKMALAGTTGNVTV